MDTFIKQPADILDYDAKFSSFLPESDTITGAAAVLDVVGELTIDAIQISGQIIKVWMSGGVTGQRYKVTVTADTFEGRRKEIDFMVRVKEI